MIDTVFFVILFLAIVQGLRKGFIPGLFSMICGLVGLASTIKFSSVLAHMEEDLYLSGRWLSIVSFFLVFGTVILLIHRIGRLMEKLIKLTMPGRLNKLSGVLLLNFFYVTVYSKLLFYGAKTPFISKQAINESHFYSLIPIGPAVVRFFAGIIPSGRDMFSVPEGFFNRMPKNSAQYHKASVWNSFSPRT